MSYLCKRAIRAFVLSRRFFIENFILTDILVFTKFIMFVEVGAGVSCPSLNIAGEKKNRNIYVAVH